MSPGASSDPALFAAGSAASAEAVPSHQRLVEAILHSSRNFEWRQATASSFAVPCGAVAAYLTIIYALQWHVRVHRHNKPFPVQTAFAYHNLLLSLLSLVMFIGAAVELVRRVLEEQSITFEFCESFTSAHTKNGARGPFYFWSYVYYLSKYYELLDTVFLAAKGKLQGWGGLNVYHHSLVLFMAWQWLEYCQSLQHIGILFNTFVHIVMYYYFYRAGLGYQPKWKKYVTALQIFQFCSSFVCFMPNLYLHFTTVGCKGQTALMFNSLFNATLLLEFVSIFKAPSSRPAKAAVDGVETVAANGKANGKSAQVQEADQHAEEATTTTNGSGMTTRRKSTAAKPT